MVAPHWEALTLQRDRAVARSRERNHPERYIEAGIVMNEKSLARPETPDTKMRRCRAEDSLMQFSRTLKLCKDRARACCGVP